MNIVIVVSVPTVMSVAIFVNKNITIDVSVAIAAKNNCCKPNFWSISSINLPKRPIEDFVIIPLKKRQLAAGVHNIYCLMSICHRRRIKTEENECKGRHYCLGHKMDSIHCCASYFAPGWFEKKGSSCPILYIVLCNLSYPSNRPGAKYVASSAKKFNWFCPTSSSDDLCLLFCLYPSSMISAF